MQIGLFGINEKALADIDKERFLELAKGKVDIDLNKLSKNYLPCVFGKYHFSKFKPMLKTYSFHNYLSLV